MTPDYGNGNHLDQMAARQSTGSTGVDFRRTCSCCGRKKDKKGGTLRANGKGFVCKECKEKTHA
jgi:hypothetical protein